MSPHPEARHFLSRWDWKLVSMPCVVEVGDKNFGMHLGLAVMPKDKLV